MSPAWAQDRQEGCPASRGVLIEKVDLLDLVISDLDISLTSASQAFLIPASLEDFTILSSRLKSLKSLSLACTTPARTFGQLVFMQVDVVTLVQTSKHMYMHMSIPTIPMMVIGLELSANY